MSSEAHAYNLDQNYAPKSKTGNLPRLQSEKSLAMSDVPSSSGQNGFFSEHMFQAVSPSPPPPPTPNFGKYDYGYQFSILLPSPHSIQKLRFRFETDLLGAQRAN
jgi:hypothetical protein